ncbi:MAG TPA: hypothetical protein VJN64_15370 [Terriglobales bacterium]|nr:hypothetical protein [Terriglobales bacterium]
MTRGTRTKQQGAALLLAMIALALLLVIVLIMTYGTMTETSVDANFRLHKQSYYAARAGLEEVRDRMRYPSTSTTAGGIKDFLPTGSPGTAASVLYVLNPSGAEVVNPADPANKYFDPELCHEYDPSAPLGEKCTTAPATAGWELPALNSINAATGQPLSYKWVRVNVKTNRAAAPFYVDGGVGAAATLDNPVCWNGLAEVLDPTAGTTCSSLNMNPVYMLTSYSAAFNARSLTRYEVAKTSIRPPGALNFVSDNAAPAFNNGSDGTGSRIPLTNIDGRPRDINGSLLPLGGSCGAASALGTDADQSSGQLQGALNDLRQNIVQRANAFCNPDGSGIGGKICTKGLWWVRGTDLTPRFDQSNGCSATVASCNKNLDLSAPQLDAIDGSFAPHIPNVVLPTPNPSAPFIGAAGNQGPALNQIDPSLLQNDVTIINQIVSDAAGQPNYFTVPSNLSGTQTYGSVTDPAIVVASGGLEVQNGANITGYGILVVDNNFQIDAATFKWTGVVLVAPPSGEFRLDSGATGSINGSLLLQADATGTTNARTSDSDSNGFTISYSCDAIDLAFQAAPLKIISYSELSY